MSKTYTIGVEFIETDPRAGKPARCALTWCGEGDSEQDAIARCCDYYGFEKDGIEVPDIRVLGDEPPEDEDAHLSGSVSMRAGRDGNPATPREAVAPAKKSPAKKTSAKKTTAKKTPAKKVSVKKSAPDYSSMTLEELAIESGMPPDRVRESLAGLLMLGDTVAGIREHLLAKLAKRKAK